MSAVETRTFGPYRIVGTLGRGGMGVVYRAEHVQSGQPVALKTVQAPDEWALSSLRREIHALARVRHPQVVRILEKGVEGGLPWYAMELLEGTTLRNFADRLFGRASTQPVSESNADTPSEPCAGVPFETGSGSLCWWTESLVRPEADSAGGSSGWRSVRSARGRSRSSPAGRSTSLRDRTRVASAHPMPAAANGQIQAVLTLARRLCTPLSFLHGEGIVHRDLKPDNVLLTSSGEHQAASSIRSDGPSRPWIDASLWPVLVDFGLISQFGGSSSRDVLELRGSSSGTIAYMAPEQILGQVVDARADLYALGCILYELITGRPPFVGSSRGVLLQRHVREPPEAMSNLVSEVPVELDTLVLRLLAKEPRERLGHADDVAAALEALGAINELTTGPRPRPYLYRPGFAGRGDALTRLREELEHLEAGRGRLVLIDGESGVGKTRLMMELAREAERRGIGVHAGECAPLLSATGSPGGGVPLGPLRPLLQSVADRCRAQGVATTERLLGRRGRLLALYEPALERLPGQEKHLEPAPLPPKQAEQRLFTGLMETLAALAGDPPGAHRGPVPALRRAQSLPRTRSGDERGPAGQPTETRREQHHAGTPAVDSGSTSVAGRSPLLLILDDLQWADDLTLGFVRFLAQPDAHRLGEIALLVVGTYRTEEVGTNSRAPLRALVENTSVTRVHLGRLDEHSVGSMVGDMLALGSPPTALVRFLTRQSEGNPFFVGEVLRTAISEGLMARDASGRWQVRGLGDAGSDEAAYGALPMPGSLRELVERRLEGLGGEARRTLEAAAVLGRELDGALLEELAGLRGERHLESVLELLTRHIMEEAAGGRLRFVHDKLREIAYQQIEPEHRATLHAEAAKGLEVRFGGRRDEDLATLGHHWEQAGDASKAGDCYRAAAKRAAARYAHGEAERLYRAYLALTVEPTRASIEARNEFAGSVLSIQGRNPAARREYTLALKEAQRIGDRFGEAAALRGLGQVCRATGEVEESQRQLDQALRLFRDIGDSAGVARTLSDLGVSDYDQGRLEQARTRFEEALELHRTTGNRQVEGLILGNLANVYDELGDPGKASSTYALALEIARAIGDRKNEGVTLGNLALQRQSEGHLAEAAALYEQALAIHRDIGHRQSEGILLSWLNRLRHEQGRAEEAASLGRQALGIHREIGNRRFEGQTLADLAILAFEAGQIEEARTLYLQSLDVQRELGNRPYQALALRELCVLERRSAGNLEAAGRLLSEAEEIAREVNKPFDLALCYCERVHLELALGHSGRTWLEEAETIARNLGILPGSALGKALEWCRRAEKAFEAGERHWLFRGDCVESLPVGLRHWLIESGQLTSGDVKSGERSDPGLREGDRPRRARAERRKKQSR